MTAYHVIADESNSGLVYLGRHSDRLIDVGDKSNLDSALFFSQRPIQATSPQDLPVIRRFAPPQARKADIAILELDPKLAKTLTGVRFFDFVPGNVSSPKPGSCVGLLGFAEDTARTIKHHTGRILSKMLGYYFTTPKIVPARLEIRTGAADLNPRHQFLMDHSPSSADSNPRGMSGCGIWIVEKVASPLWAIKSLKLVGVQTGWYKDFQVLVGTRIELLDRLLVQAAS